MNTNCCEIISFSATCFNKITKLDQKKNLLKYIRMLNCVYKIYGKYENIGKINGIL